MQVLAVLAAAATVLAATEKSIADHEFKPWCR